MALDCENAFNQEMAVLNGISQELKDIKKVIKADTDVSELHSLFLKIDETNRLLKFLCENLLGASK